MLGQDDVHVRAQRLAQREGVEDRSAQRLTADVGRQQPDWRSVTDAVNWEDKHATGPIDLQGCLALHDYAFTFL